MLVNFAWPRAATNPTPNQTGLGLNFHWSWLNSRPVLWTVLVVIVLRRHGLLPARAARKPAYLQAPSGASFAPDTPVAGDAVST